MASKANIIIDQGATFSTKLNLTDSNGDPLDISQYSVSAQMRKWYTSSNFTQFQTTVDAEGIINLTLSSSQTSVLNAGRYVYDVELTHLSTNEVSRVVEGIATVTPQVTRQ